MIRDLEKRIMALETRLNQMIRIGKVSTIDPAAGTARVILPDSGGVVSYDLPILFKKTQNDKYYSMPDIGEQVLCLFLPNGQEQGFIIGSFFSQIDSTPVNDPDKTHVKFRDNTSMEYDRKKHRLTVNIKGRVLVNATGPIEIIGSTIDLNRG